MPAGRPSSYRPEYAELAYKFALLGITDERLAEFFDIVPQTLYNWKEAHPEFLEALTRGKEEADANVAKSFYHRALGYSHEAVKIFNNDGQPMVVPYTEHYPPDTGACLSWLKNRQPKLWRDRIEHTGADGGPITLEAMLIAGEKPKDE